MLTYVVMERLSRGEVKITDTITVSKEASRMGGSQVYLKEGETFSLEEMMKAILVASANDAAYAVAEHIAGTPEGFVQMMNEKAKELGMVDSEFNTVHGLPPSKGQKEDITSCSDLALLARAIINKYPKVIEWTSISQEGFRDRKLMMYNHNKLLLKMPGIVDGLKTGYYSETGYNIVATGKRDGLRLIIVVLGSPSAKIRDDVAIERFKIAFSRLKMVDIVKKGEVIDKDIVLVDGKYRKIKGVAAAGLSYPIFKDKKAAIKMEPVISEKIKGEVKGRSEVRRTFDKGR
jgi:D-alanyl-D-alanine carboxypeptidase (penicillin-binding protein 5/6)